MRMVQFHQLPSLLSLTLILFLSLLIDDAGIIHEQLVIVKFFDNELLLELIVRIEEELATHEEKRIGHYVQKRLHCGQSYPLSFVRQDQKHSFEESRGHESIGELNDLPLSDLLILFVHILSPQNFEKFQEGKTNQGLELLEDHVQKGHDFGVGKQLLIDAAFLALWTVDVMFFDGLKCLLKWVNFLSRLVGILLTRRSFVLSLEQSHIIPYIFFEDELMFLHETHLEVLISPHHICLLILSLFLCSLRPAHTYLRLQVIFYLLRFLSPKREVFLVEAEKVIPIAVQVSHLVQIVIAHCPSF